MCDVNFLNPLGVMHIISFCSSLAVEWHILEKDILTFLGSRAIKVVFVLLRFVTTKIN